MKRILTLDGGGIRGVFSLEVLLRIETLLRDYYRKPDLVLADHFDLFAGTSTGAIIATCLCWGMDVQTILDLYVANGVTMFAALPWYKTYHKYFVARYDPRPLSRFLLKTFSEDGDGQVPSMLDSDKLKKMLLVVVRNHTTGSAWPLTNNPKAIYSDRDLADPPGSQTNLDVPLWKIVRASTAAPTFFDPEVITLNGQEFVFVDGSVTPYNNPSLIAFQTATLPCYRMNWPTGAENLRVISVGTLRFLGTSLRTQKLWVGYLARQIPLALIQGVTWQQDYACRTLGRCLYGEPLDSEIGDLVSTAEVPILGPNLFSYVRYNQTYKAAALDSILAQHPRLAQLDSVGLIPILREIGAAYAQQHIKLEHLI